MKLGIIAAMDIEAEQLVAAMKDAKKETVSGIEFTSGKLGNADAVIAVCGIGKVFAALCAEAMILRYQPDAVINTGIAGSLSETLSIGSIVISEAVVHHDLDVTPLGTPYGYIMELDSILLPADEKLIAKIEGLCGKLGISHEVGVVASGDQFVAAKERKEFIVSQFGAIACEMEGAAIGHVCYVNKVPFVILRSISDGANEDALMDYPTFRKLAAAKGSELMLEFTKGLDA